MQEEHPAVEDVDAILVDSNDQELSSFEFFMKERQSRQLL